jgi:hypothetical protein
MEDNLNKLKDVVVLLKYSFEVKFTNIWKKGEELFKGHKEFILGRKHTNFRNGQLVD